MTLKIKNPFSFGVVISLVLLITSLQYKVTIFEPKID